MRAIRSGITIIIGFFLIIQTGWAKDNNGDENSPCFHHEEEFNPGKTAFHHISDQNIYSVGPFHFNLPCFLYAKDEGFSFFSAGKFHAHQGHHGNGEMAYKRYVLQDGVVKRIKDPGFSKDHIKIDGVGYKEVEKDGEVKEVGILCYGDQTYELEQKSTADFGLFGGGITSFYDFSITKNVFTMFLVSFLLGWMFLSIAKAAKRRDGMAPKGVQSFMEPIFEFIQDDVVKPFLGSKWEKYQPFIMALFFFILGLNLFGQIPFLGGSNVTGNLSVTFVLAIFAFIVTNFSGNKHYWGHVLWMPGVPPFLKALIITPVEIMGLFIKPLTLMLRLFGNITAGHMVIIIFVGLIFIFGENGKNVGAAIGVSVGSVLLTLFMMAIELLVAFIQAFVFAILTASYIGAAVEENHH